jgi:type VI secretion system protein
VDGAKILTLTVINADGLRGNAPPPFTVSQRDVVIGRAPACDWALPDPRSYISSKHAEIRYFDGAYLFSDISMNGTFLNGAAERMRGSHRLRHGDVLLIGHYEIKVALEAKAVEETPPPSPKPRPQRAHTSWERITDRHKVDWLRAGFNQGAANADGDAAALAQVVDAASAGRPGRREARSASAADQGAALFLEAAGLDRQALSGSAEDVLGRAGQLLRLLVSGLVVMVEAWARAKSEMGAETTTLRYDGNNPIKFTHTPEQALMQLLTPAQRGFMAADRAVEDAFQDLQTHQLATLEAMEGAMQATLAYFSPDAVRARAETGTLAARVLPGGRDAALWRQFEQDYEQTALDEAFTAIFIREFRAAYEELARRR